jgi:hypothetical protein
MRAKSSTHHNDPLNAPVRARVRLARVRLWLGYYGFTAYGFSHGYLQLSRLTAI